MHAIVLPFICVVLSTSTVAEEIVLAERGALIDQYMQRQAAKGFSGALLVAVGGEVNVKKGYGLADRENNVPVTAETVFDIGSITKQFTGAAIMKLVSERKLSVEDPITKFFDNVPDDERAITVHHLLTHSSGLRDVFGGDYEIMERDALMGLILESRLKRPVGERYMYSNSGYSMLGAIVEKVSGLGYEAFLRKHFFDPLGIADTGYVLPKWAKSRLAVGYSPNGERWGTPLDHRWAEHGPYWNLRCNGGILSTVGDMYKWHLALASDAVLPESARTAIFSPHQDEGNGRSFYGYGWAITTTNRGTMLITHNGGNGIFFADMFRYVEEDVVVIYMTNFARDWESTQIVRDVALGIRTELPDEE